MKNFEETYFSSNQRFLGQFLTLENIMPKFFRNWNIPDF